MMQFSKWMRLLLAFAAMIAWAAPACADDGLARVKERGKLIAGVKFDTPPFGYLDDDNQPVGFDLDLVRAVGARLGVPVEFVKVTSPTRIPLLVSGNVDLVAASMTDTPERAKVIDFSITYYTGAQSLIVAKASGIGGLKDLAGRTVAVQQGTTLEKNIAAAAPAARIIGFRDYTSAWLALVQGRADALTGSLDVLRGFARENANFVILPDRFSIEPFGIGVRHGDAALRAEIDATLRELWTSGRYAELYRKWFHADPEFPIDTKP